MQQQQDNESVLLSTFRKIIEVRERRRQLKAIDEGNESRRGVIEYAPSQIEGFFDINEPLGNIIASGGDCNVRCRIVAAAAACAATQGVPVIVLHCGNTDMERQLGSMFAGAPIFQVINRSNPIYEPLTDLNDSEISQLLVQSGAGLTAVPSGGKYYIEALAAFLRAKGINPYCKMFFTCPHQKMVQAVDAAVQARQLSAADGQHIKSLIMQGQNYRSTVETYFSRLEQQSNHILCGKSRLNHRVSLYKSAQQKMVTVLDIATDTNDLLLNVIAGEIERILASGIPLCLAIDDISLASNENIARLLRSSVSTFWRVITSRDFFSMAGSSDAVFSDITNNAQKLFIAAHSGISCTKWAQLIGEYDKDEISKSFATSNHYRSFFSVLPSQGDSQNITVAQKREYIFKPEMIARFAWNEIVIINRIEQEIAHTFVV